jgi:long-chain acyl-CoA synthetase
MAADTIVHRLFEQARIRPHAPAYFAREGDSWRATSFSDHANEVRRAAKALMALGVEAGSTVGILGFNRPEWVVMDLACMAAGGAPAGIYATCSAEEVRYIVDHAESPVVLVENEEQWRKLARERARLPKLRTVVTMRGAAPIDDPIVLSWEAFLQKGDAVSEARLDDRVLALEPGGLATLIYTSGTTGPPKGVMLSHHNLAWTAEATGKLIEAGPWDRLLSYLPLSHVAEQVLTIHGSVTHGYAVYFARSIEAVLDDLKEVEPTILFGVPRIWEKFHAGIVKKLDEVKSPKREIVGWARAIGRQASELAAEGKTPGRALGTQYDLANKLVFSKLKSAMGLRRARVCVSGAAPIAREVLEFFASVDILVHEVYGQSEGSGPTSFNRPSRTRFGTVGLAFPGVEVRTAEDGEILLRGPNVFLGYFKDPEATREVLRNRWLYSGDLGRFDAAGYLSITGRKKEILITAGGKNIAPKNIESALKQHPPIADVVVIGDQRPYLTALVTIDPEAAAALAKASARPHEAPEVKRAIQRAVDAVNETLARVEQVKRFVVLERPFGVDTGELTPTLKIKRKVVEARHAGEIEAMYAQTRATATS